MGEKLKIVFMGTPAFAVAILQEIMLSPHHVIGIVTVPDKPSGRGLQLNESAVKKFAKELSIPIFQPDKLKNKDFIQQLKNLKANVFVVVAFRILPKEVFSIPPLGTFNLHASLLPQLRGAAPINFAIINGLQETGVTTFFLDENIDTGALLLQDRLEISPQDDAGILHDKLMNLGKKLVIKTLNGIANKTILPIKQTIENTLMYAPKIEKEDCLINWENSPTQIQNFIRGMSPNPCAHTIIEINAIPKILKIYKSNIINNKPNLPKYSIYKNKSECKIALENVWINLTEVQLEGKKRMKIIDFLNGLQGKELLLKIL